MAEANNGFVSSDGVVIQIKRSQNRDAPTRLANGELGYSFSSDKLFIGATPDNTSATEVRYIGGKLLVDKVANLELILAGGGTGASLSNVVVANTATIDKLVLSTYEPNSVLYTNENGEVTFARGTSGGVLQISANGVPSFGNLDGGTF